MFNSITADTDPPETLPVTQCSVIISPLTITFEDS